MDEEGKWGPFAELEKAFDAAVPLGQPVVLSWDTASELLATARIAANEIVSLREEVAALESKEVCTAPHDDSVIEGCPYCEIERLRRLLTELDITFDPDAERAQRQELSDLREFHRMVVNWGELSGKECFRIIDKCEQYREVKSEV